MGVKLAKGMEKGTAGEMIVETERTDIVGES